MFHLSFFLTAFVCLLYGFCSSIHRMHVINGVATITVVLFHVFVNVCRDCSRYFLGVGVPFEIMDLKEMICNAVLLTCLSLRCVLRFCETCAWCTYFDFYGNAWNSPHLSRIWSHRQRRQPVTGALNPHMRICPTSTYLLSRKVRLSEIS